MTSFYLFGCPPVEKSMADRRLTPFSSRIAKLKPPFNEDFSLPRSIMYNIYIYLFICISISIWANYNNSLTWNKAILGWFPLLTMIPGLGRYNSPSSPRCKVKDVAIRSSAICSRMACWKVMVAEVRLTAWPKVKAKFTVILQALEADRGVHGSTLSV